jgi:hypothetical protein
MDVRLVELKAVAMVGLTGDLMVEMLVDLMVCSKVEVRVVELAVPSTEKWESWMVVLMAYLLADKLVEKSDVT